MITTTVVCVATYYRQVKENIMIKITKEMILESNDTSWWLKNALRTLLERDPVDALNDVEVLKIVAEKELLPKIAYRSTQ